MRALLMCVVLIGALAYGRAEASAPKACSWDVARYVSEDGRFSVAADFTDPLKGGMANKLVFSLVPDNRHVTLTLDQGSSERIFTYDRQGERMVSFSEIVIVNADGSLDRDWPAKGRKAAGEIIFIELENSVPRVFSVRGRPTQQAFRLKCP